MGKKKEVGSIKPPFVKDNGRPVKLSPEIQKAIIEAVEGYHPNMPLKSLYLAYNEFFVWHEGIYLCSIPTMP